MNWEKVPPWPFQRLRSMQRRDVGLVAVCGPFSDQHYQGEMERGLFWSLKAKGHVMVGLSSYMHFPGEIHNPINSRHVAKHRDVIKAMDVWLHCFRDPDNYLPKGVPRILMSESDFYDCNRKDAGGVLQPQNLEKKYDFIYINGGGPWNDYNRNWTFARQAIALFAREFNMTTYILGRPLGDDKMLEPFVKSGLIIPGSKMAWGDFLNVLEQARALFVPNVHDASPRVVAEGFCRNVPVLMSWHIAGGWKYVNDATGVFFHDLTDLPDSVRRLRDPGFQLGLAPRKYYMDNYGKQRSSARLHAFLELAIGRERLAGAFRLGSSIKGR